MNFKLSEYTRIILFTPSDTQTSKKAIIRVLPTAVEPYDQFWLLVCSPCPWSYRILMEANLTALAQAGVEN